MARKQPQNRYRYMEDHSLSRGRLWLIGAAMAAITVIYLGVLADAQVLHHEEWVEKSSTSIIRAETVKASRGIVTDRNGTPLITNSLTYDLTFDDALLPGDAEPNTELLRLLRLCTQEKRSWADAMPVSWREPFTFTVYQASKKEKQRFLNYLISLPAARSHLGSYMLLHRDLVDTSDIDAAAAEAEENAEPETWRDKLKSVLGRGSKKSAVPTLNGRQLLERLQPEQLTNKLLEDAGLSPYDLLKWMRNEFDVPEDFTDMEARTVLGVWYELKQRRLGDNSVYHLTENVDTEFLSLLADGDYKGYRVLTSSVRQYETDSAAHILGTVGYLQEEDLENSFYENYPLDAVVGRSGTESAFEQYLHGIDGRLVQTVSEDGKITGAYYSKTPQPGSTVELTLDLNLQKASEQALKEIIEELNVSLPAPTRGAGVAVIKVGTGEVLSLATYPTFNLEDYHKTSYYKQLTDDPAKPLLNRATAGLYAPGSTLKPATAIAALSSGKVTLRERLYDSGRWVYPGTNLYTNCWVLSGHGYENVTTAITDSCNYFFAEMGYRMGMDTLNEYYAQFGLGEHTGIETGDSTGNRPFNPVGQNQAPWAAYGQSNQRYTPLQLANYIATVASGGKHCEAHLLKAVKAYDNSAVIAEGNTTPVNTVEIKDEYLEAVRTGMHNLVHGSLWSRFSECVVDAAAKTGTAQVTLNSLNNGVFVCFAPYDEPEIAIGMVIEKSNSGAALASTAVKILNAYFSDDAAEAVTGENMLLP